MTKFATLATALARAFVGNGAFADDSGGGGSGDSGGGDNSMSRWTGESYKAFEQARTASGTVTISRASRDKLDIHAERPRFAHLSRKPAPVNPFRDDTA